MNQIEEDEQCFSTKETETVVLTFMQIKNMDVKMITPKK